MTAPGPRRAAFIPALVALLAAACGSHLSHDEIVAAARGSQGQATEFQPDAVSAPVSSPVPADSGAPLNPGVRAASAAPAGTGPASAAAGTGGQPAAPSAGATAPVAKAGATQAASQPVAPQGGGGSPAEAQPQPACGSVCAPLVIGSVGTWSGIAGQNIVAGMHALRAWVAATNAEGGLGGHPVQLLVADDGSDPARHRALVQQFVEEKGVVAFVYNAAVFSGHASVDYLNSKRIPVVGGSGTEPWYVTSPMFFTQVVAGDVAIEATVASYARSAKAGGKSKMGLVTCSDGAQVCEDIQRKAPGYAAKYGLQLVYQGEASLAAPDFTSNCLAARDAGVELLMLAMDANSYQRFGRSCANISYRPLFGIPQPVMLEDLARDPNLQGSPGMTYTAPAFLEGNAAIAEFRAALGRYSPSTYLNGSATLGWTAAKLLQAVAPRLSNPPRPADVLDGLWSLNGNDLGGLTAALRFRRDQPTVPATCYWQVVVKDQKYQSPDGGQRHCEGG